MSLYHMLLNMNIQKQYLNKIIVRQKCSESPKFVNNVKLVKKSSNFFKYKNFNKKI